MESQWSIVERKSKARNKKIIVKHVGIRKDRFKEAMVGYAFLLPSLLGVGIFILVPFLDVIRRSFSEAMTRTFVGTSNYEMVLNNQAFLRAAKNTIRFIFVCIPLLLVISLILSVMLYSIHKLQAFLKTSFLIPMAIPTASIVLLWKIFYHKFGLLNKLLEVLGMTAVDWINTDKAFYVLVFTYLWENIGYDMVLWLAGLNGISQEMYEASSIDGAGRIRQFFFITLPNLLPTTFILIVLSLINSFKVFREAYLLAGDYPHESIYMLQHLFNNWFTSLDIQKMCATAVMVALVLIVVIGLLNMVLGKDRT